MIQTLLVKTQPSTFEQTLLELGERIRIKNPVNLYIEENLTEEQLLSIEKWINTLPEDAINRIDIPVTYHLISSLNFLPLLTALKNKSTRVLKLLFDRVELQSATEEKLLDFVSFVNFPILIEDKETRQRIGLERFQRAITQVIQCAAKPQKGETGEGHENDSLEEIPDFGGEPIRLKSLIKSQGAIEENTFNQFVQIELQHTEVVEETIEETVTTEVVTENTIAYYTGDLINYSQFNTPAYHRMAESFFKPEVVKESFKQVEYECFANLPQAIKFLTPEAAKKMAVLLPQFLSLNKENLPAGFLLKKTLKEEFVLDYDETAIDDDRTANLFTPSEYIPLDERRPYYFIDFDPPHLRTLISNEKIYESLEKVHFVPLMNLWVRYGDKGIREFFLKLNHLEQAHPGFSAFLYEHYFAHFDHLENFCNETFFDEMVRLENFTPLQINCLKRFLQNTGTSQHELSKTLDGFEYFWRNFSLLCKDNLALMQLLDTNWVVPCGGQPLVYMERLLAILNNARNLQDQLSCLQGISLSQYGAYYASKYEGFTGVHPSMVLDYDPQKINAIPFNSAFQLYRIELATLFEIVDRGAEAIKEDYCLLKNLFLIDTSCSLLSQDGFKELQAQGKVVPLTLYMSTYVEVLPPTYGCFYHYGGGYGAATLRSKNVPLSAPIFYKLVFRFLGTQLAGVSIGEFFRNFQEIRQEWTKIRERENETSFLWTREEVSFSIHMNLVKALLLLTSERVTGSVEYFTGRYNDTTDIRTQPTLRALIGLADTVDISAIIVQLHLLRELFNRNIRFNDLEAICYLTMQNIWLKHILEKEKFGGYEASVTLWPAVKEEYSQRLHKLILSNKYPTYKFIQLIGKQKAKKAALYAINTHDFFQESPAIATTFADSLILFSALLRNFNFNITSDNFFTLLQSSSEDIPSSPPKIPLYELCGEINGVNFNLDYWRWVTREEIPQLKRIRDYLQEATTGLNATNSLYYAYQLLIDAEQFLSYSQVIAIFDAVSRLPLVEALINIAEIHKIFNDHGVQVRIKMPEVLQYDNEEVKQCLLSLITGLEIVKTRGLQIGADFLQMGMTLAHNFLLGAPLSPEANIPEELIAELEQVFARLSPLSGKSVSELQVVFQEQLSTCNFAIAFLTSQCIKPILWKLKSHLIAGSFERHLRADEDKELINKFTEITLNLSDIRDESNFEKINQAINKAESIAIVCGAIARHPCILEQQEAFLKILSNVQIEKIDSELLLQLFNLLTKMPQRDYIPLLKEMLDSSLIYNKEAFIFLLGLITKLHDEHFSTQGIVNFCRRCKLSSFTDFESFEEFMRQLIEAHSYDTEDPLLLFLLADENFTVEQVQLLSTYTYQIRENREKITDLVRFIGKQNLTDTFLQQLAGLEAPQRASIITVISKAYAMRRPQDPTIDILRVVKHLQRLSCNQLNEILKLYSTSVTSIACLANALSSYDPQAPFADFLQAMEIAPFGMRCEKEEFNCDEVERVVNESSDLLNKTSYPYSYRKQLMEIFLLVNEMGYKLPVFKGKTINYLTNLEIKSLFLELKNNTHLSTMAKRINALALMREAMYRATGQFPYSTQLIVLIDSMLHEGNVVSNVDTGQGKSLIDVMKAAFLWLESDRVDVTTSSIADAKRDIANYSAFLELLGVPFSKKPVTPTSQLSEFCTNGINFSTFAQLSLFFSRAIASDHSLDTPRNRISLVANESDKSFLDELTIYRFASTEGAKISKKHAWIYTAIMEYVQLPGFTRCDTSANTDIRRLRRFLSNKARLLGKSGTILAQLDNERLLNWIESAVLVQYKLRENFDYVVMPLPDNTELHAAKVLMRDTRVSPDSVFGNGMHQLLHAKLNAEKRVPSKTGEDSFLIEPENRTIISSSNFNLLMYYLSRNGFVWCSSGTVGSEAEIEEQHGKYGFPFSKIEPHQAKQVTENNVVILSNEEEQLTCLASELKSRRINQSQEPLLIFCQDIEKAKKIFGYLSQCEDASPMQLFTGIEDEVTAIAQAAVPGMVTVTTAAIGRNTDIAYNKRIGMDIWHTCIESTRIDRQKSGRTGRQGSKGTISYFLNEENQKVHSQEEINQLRRKLDHAAKIEREFNEEFYAILGNLLSQVEKIPSSFFSVISKQEFIKKKWATFSNTLEQFYRELRLKNMYVREQFNQHATKTVVEMLKEAAPDFDGTQIKEYVETIHPSRESYHPYTKRVRIKDCMPPVKIAYELFDHNTDNSTTIDDAKKQTIMQALNALFLDQEQSDFLQKNTVFFNHLIASEVGQAQLRAIYEEFLQTFLQTHACSTFVNRWLGVATPLSRIANNQYYLCLFQAFSTVNKAPSVKERGLQETVLFLIEEYLQNSWFISSAKRQAAIELQKSIRSATEMQSIIAVLQQGQLTIAEQDIQTNTSLWRLFKPVNLSGSSRLQNTISTALNLACSLGVQTHEDQLITDLTKHLGTSMKDDATSFLSPSADALKNLSLYTNKKVIGSCMEHAIQRRNESRYAKKYSIFADGEHRGEPTKVMGLEAPGA
ncbi:coiled-coil protein (plasmid) [Legionella adelaidensis]|uniref:Coiled-coil protein n=1 Tax=Legionella adelaidensis TaxID=45056 RepID=A0A0W0R2W0_9GAMM|nr:hypothetical protein [Legionella adelaidensis]KTC65404.1 coiled-coil protein [Legionella adelaidensis]VEH84774.1 coiled-coil protein [Legionella adelaidensis]